LSRHGHGLVLLAVVALLLGCATSERFLWEEYTGMGAASVAAGEYRQAEQLLTRALAKAEALTAKEQGISLNGLGELYRRQGRLPDAERMFLRSLDVKEAGLGRDHPDVAVTLTNLGLVYMAEGRDQEAEPLLERALAIQETRLPPKSAALGRTVTALVEVYRHLGREDKMHALETRRRPAGTEPPPRR
jgi:tetratricopeptide (TPR) repeat protein